MIKHISSAERPADLLIGSLLSSLLDRTPDSALVCLNVVGPPDGQAMVRAPRNAVGRLRRSAAMQGQMRSLLDWDRLLPALREGNCPLVRVGAADVPTRSRVWPYGGSSVLACPATVPMGDLRGAVLIAWNGAAAPPDGAELTSLMDAGAAVGTQIAAVLDLCEQAARPAVVV